MADLAADNYTILTRAAWLAVGTNSAASLAAGTEIVVTRNGSDASATISQLDNIEETVFDRTGDPLLNVTSHDGNGSLETNPPNLSSRVTLRRPALISARSR